MTAPGRCGGATLVVLLTLWVLVGAALLLGRLGSQGHGVKNNDAGREVLTRRSLAAAEGALIAWAVSASSASGRSVAPGRLPFPDRNRDGNYDGKADCVTFGLNASHLLGRLPWAGSARPCAPMGLHVEVRDSAGERLWYAVSRNLVERGAGGPINPDMGEPGNMAHPWIVVRDADGRVIHDPRSRRPLPVAAAIIAPGAALEYQDRSAVAPGPENYLDRIAIGATIYDNADADGCPDGHPAPCGASRSGEEFVLRPGSPPAKGFNDRLAIITVSELVRAVEKRVLGEAAIALNRYHVSHGAYPWLASFTDPRSADFKSDLYRQGQLPVHLRDETFATRFTGSWNLVDTTPTTTLRHSGDASLVPPLADGLSGSITVSREHGRCRWSDWTRGSCNGARLFPVHLRHDLKKTVTRTVEIGFDIVDDTPRVIPPTASDVRRRSLSVSAAALPRSASLAWSIRITDHDGSSWGQRDITIDADTGGAMSLTGIRYDLSVVYDGLDDARDELPEWLVENEWQRFIYVAISSDAVPGGNADGDGDCATPLNTCLTLKVDGETARSDVRALVISSGAQWTGQDRGIGDCDDDGIHDDYLCAYFEGDNSDKSSPVAVDTYARDGYSAWFNDQVRVVAPLPP